MVKRCDGEAGSGVLLSMRVRLSRLERGVAITES